MMIVLPILPSIPIPHTQYNCYNCQRTHCSNCIRKGSDDKRRCPHCLILQTPPLIRDYLVAVPTVVLRTHAQAKGIQFVRPIAKEDLVSAILQDQVTHLHQQLEAAKREVSQCSVNSSSVTASSLSSTPAVSEGASSGMVGEGPSVLEGQLLVLPESQGELSLFELGRPSSSSEGSSGVGVGGAGGNIRDISRGALSQREGKTVVDVGTQTRPSVDMSQSCDSLYTMQLPGQTDSMWQIEETLVRTYQYTWMYFLNLGFVSQYSLCI